VGYAVTQEDSSDLSSQRDVFDAGPVRVICCDGQTGTGTGGFSDEFGFPFAGSVG
jgi:hypothetical protein